MHDPLPVRLIQSVGDLDAEAKRLLERQCSFRQAVSLSFEVLHDQVLDAILVAHVVQRADVRVGQCRYCFRLALETLARLGRGESVRQHFDRDLAAEASVARSIDFSHPAGAQRREDLVGAEAGTGWKWHRSTAAAILCRSGEGFVLRRVTRRDIAKHRTHRRTHARIP